MGELEDWKKDRDSKEPSHGKKRGGVGKYESNGPRRVGAGKSLGLKLRKKKG